MLDLRFNNNKTFMQEQRDRYHRVMRDPYYALINALAPLMLSIDPQMEVRPHKVLSRIFRDTRFSRDKSPYRDHHWIAFRRAGEPRDRAVMFWFEARVEGLSWGLGFWGENRPAMDMLRRRMISHPDDMLSAMDALKGRPLVITGESFKRMAVPEELHKRLKPYYAKKGLFVNRKNYQPEWLFTEELLPQLQADYQAMAPFYRLLRGYHDLSTIEGFVHE